MRLLTVRFSLKDGAYFKPSICNTKVGKSKTWLPIKATFRKHPLQGLHGLMTLQAAVPQLWCALVGTQRHCTWLFSPGRTPALVETAFPRQDGRTVLFLSACPIFQGTGISHGTKGIMSCLPPSSCLLPTLKFTWLIFLLYILISTILAAGYLPLFLASLNHSSLYNIHYF